jgi:outer membrane murein-binding lipoprotein Lpp
MVLGGCSSSDPNDSLWGQVKSLNGEKDMLTARAESLEKENQQLRQQVQTLHAIDGQQRAASLDILTKIEIGSRSGLYDKDNNGSKETLAIYLEPIDSSQDKVKAPGRVEVELWNLDSSNPQGALLKQWVVEPEQLKTLWAGTLMSSFYRLSFPVDQIVKGDEKGLTVKVRFTDYIAGKVLSTQQPIVQ